MGALTTLSSSAFAEEFTRRSYTLPDGAFEITGEPARPKLLGVNLSRGAVAEPVYVAPHFYWGVSERLTLGVTHQRGLCLTGDQHGCGRVYDDVGFGLIAGIHRSEDVEIDFHLGVPISSFDPFTVGTRLGALMRWNFGRVALVLDPYLYFRITRRDDPPGGPDAVAVPVWVYFQPTRRVAPFVGVELRAPLDGFPDHAVGAAEGGVIFEVTNDVDLGVVLRFDRPFGHRHSFHARELGMLARFRF